MRKNLTKKLSIAAGCLAIACTSFGGVALASAETADPVLSMENGGDFYMVEGAGVKLYQGVLDGIDGNAMRFVFEMSEAQYASMIVEGKYKEGVSVSSYVIAEEKIDEGKETALDIATDASAIETEIPANKWTKATSMVEGSSATVYYACAYVYNVPEEYYGENVASFAVATLEDDRIATSVQSRSMSYVAQKALESGKYDEDREILEGYIVAEKPDVIVDFTDVNAIETYGLTGNWDAGIVYDTNEQCVRMDSNTWASLTGMFINNPTITNISTFKYIYVDVKVGWGDADFVFNYAWGSPYLTLKGNGTWTRVVAVNDGTGKFTIVNETGNMSGMATGASIFGGEGKNSSNISGALFSILSAGNNVYFKSFAACNELPELPAGFKTNYVVAEKPVVIADLSAADAVNKYSVTSNWGAPLVAWPHDASPAGGSGSLQIDNSTGGGSTQGIIINNPAIKDVSGYNYIYIDVKAGYNDMPFGFYGWQKATYTIPAQTWVRVVLVNDGNGNFTMPGGTNSDSALNGSSTDISQELLWVQTVEYDYFYFGTFAACNELPELPQGMLTNYTA